ncbi:hypothetical protein GW796_11545 [archaeon]|nr:hypothetical protein [archaeon]
MTQTIKTITITPHTDIVVFDAVNVLKRCFFGIYALNLTTSILDYLKISFADTSFTNSFTLSPYHLFFECDGKNVFQGTVLIRNTSAVTAYTISTTEILE